MSPNVARPLVGILMSAGTGRVKSGMVINIKYVAKGKLMVYMSRCKLYDDAHAIQAGHYKIGV